MRVLTFGDLSFLSLDHRRYRNILVLQRAAYTRSVAIASRASGRRAPRRGLERAIEAMRTGFHTGVRRDGE